MEISEKIKKLPKNQVLQHIPYDQEFTYEETKSSNYKIIARFGKQIKDKRYRAFPTAMYHAFDLFADENGMDMLVIEIAGMFYEMENEPDMVEHDLAYRMSVDIEDFETGYYDDLFSPSDLAAIKQDLQTIKTYLKEHPDLLED